MNIRLRNSIRYWFQYTTHKFSAWNIFRKFGKVNPKNWRWSRKLKQNIKNTPHKIPTNLKYIFSERFMNINTHNALMNLIGLIDRVKKNESIPQLIAKKKCPMSQVWFSSFLRRSIGAQRLKLYLKIIKLFHP